MIKETFFKKTIDDIIVCLEEVKLKIAGGIEKVTLSKQLISFQNYIAVSTVKLDSEKIEEGFYNSKLILYDIDPVAKAFDSKFNDNHSMMITCLSYY
jgi:hypothetical protein